MQNKIGVFVGSLRKEAWSRKLAKALIKLAPSSLELEIIEIANLPLYNQDPDDEGRPHPEWVSFRDKVRPLDGLLFITPEYNRSVPAPLKNAIDVGSRPYGKSVWGPKPGAIVSCSPGAIAGFGANQHLRQPFVFLDIRCMQQPEAYIGNVDKIFDEEDNLSSGSTKDFLNQYMHKFADWVSTFTAKQ